MDLILIIGAIFVIFMLALLYFMLRLGWRIYKKLMRWTEEPKKGK